MKTTTTLIALFTTLLPLTSAQAASDFIAEGFSPAAASYFATAIANPGISSAFDAAESAVATVSVTNNAIAPTDANGNLNPTLIIAPFLAGLSAIPSAQAAIITSVAAVLESLQAGGGAAGATAGSSAASKMSSAASGGAAVSSAASSLAKSASSAAASAGTAASSAASAGAASATSHAAAAPKQTMAVGLMGAMLAGVAGLAVAL